MTGWSLTDPELVIAPFHQRRYELSLLDGYVLWGSRVIVPTVGRDIVMDQLHDCHPGVSRMKNLARGFVWWPKIEDIERTVRSCRVCQEN